MVAEWISTNLIEQKMEDKTIPIYDLDHVQDYDLVAEDIHPVHDQDQDRHTTNRRRQGVSCP